MCVHMFQSMCVCLFEFVSCTVSVWHEHFVLCVLHHNKLLPGFLFLCYLFSRLGMDSMCTEFIIKLGIELGGRESYLRKKATTEDCSFVPSQGSCYFANYRLPMKI